MADIVVIIGNGFDLDLGLPTRYSDFIKSDEWKNAVGDFCASYTKEYLSAHSLIYHLRKASTNLQWFDLEEEIHKFINSHPENTERVVSTIRNEFGIIKKALTNYLKRISKSFMAKENKLSYRFLSFLSLSQYIESRFAEFNFNYTSPFEYTHINFLAAPEMHHIIHVHGSLEGDDIVLGCDIQPNEVVNRQLSFMYKYNMLKGTNNIARELLDAKEIIFFGHSINEMDFCYFREFFKAASANPNQSRNLTIITYDEESERAIKDNIRNQGISVTDLYSNLSRFDFIQTKKYYKINYDANYRFLEHRINHILYIPKNVIKKK